MHKRLTTQVSEERALTNREIALKLRVSYDTHPLTAVYAARLYQVPRAVDEITFGDITDFGERSKRAREISFTKYKVARDNTPKSAVLLEIKRLALRPATFHEFAAFLQHYPTLRLLRSLVCLGSHGRVNDRPVLLSMVREHGFQSLYFEDAYRRWQRGTNILCVIEQN